MLLTSYDRVLPKPAALYDEAARNRVPRQTTNLLEHKIMNDQSTITTVAGRSNGRPSQLYLTDATPHSPSLIQMHLSPVNREKLVQNGVSSNILPVNKPAMTPNGEEEIFAREQSASSTSSQSDPPREQATQFCLCQPDPKIPRPRNAFILYRQHYQATVVAQNPGLANPEISKIIGEQWRALPNETKKEWKALAEEEKARHQQQYPDYRYQPRRYGKDGNVRSAIGSGIGNNPTGATVCNRCGGRLMNPPSTPNTPLVMSAQANNNRPFYADPASPLRSSHGIRESSGRLMSPVKPYSEPDRRARHWDVEENAGTMTLDAKRRRLTATGLRRPSRGDLSPIVESYAVPGQRTYVARTGHSHLREHYHMLPPLRPGRGAEESRLHDASLTLPPLQAASPRPQSQRDVEATVMTIPFINKIKVLAKISPPLITRPMSTDSHTRGAVIAVDGQEPALVNIMMKYLGSLLTKTGKYSVRVFEGPEIHFHPGVSKVGEMEDATMDYLNVISAWHRISGEIVQFINPSSRNVDTRMVDDSSPDLSPTSTVPKSAKVRMHMDSSDSEVNQNGVQAATAPNPIPIALVPRYQLSTADLFACAIPINDSYAPLDHWQWMASLWRGCVGPDVTIYIRECEKEEVDRYGGGNPVEVRLQDARTIITRKTQGSPREIEEKALRRVGFEIEEFLTR